MIVPGVISGVTGIAIMSSGSHFQSYSTGSSSGVTTVDPAGATAMVLTVLAIPLVAAGTVLAIIGTHKRREYKQRVQAFTSYDPAKKKIGASVAFALGR